MFCRSYGACIAVLRRFLVNDVRIHGRYFFLVEHDVILDVYVVVRSVSGYCYRKNA